MTEQDKICIACSARDMILDYFQKEIGDGQVGTFLNGVIEAAAAVAAAYVLPQHVDAQRKIMADQIGERFEFHVGQMAAQEREGATVQ